MVEESQRRNLNLTQVIHRRKRRRLSVEGSVADIYDVYAGGVALLNAGLIFIIFFISACVQPSAPRMFAGVIFSVISIGLLLVGPYLNDYLTYAVPAMAAVLVMILISASMVVSKVVLSIHKICLFSIVLNAGGYLLYESGESFLIYNASFFLLYVWTIRVLLKRDGRLDVTGYGADSWRSTVSYASCSWVKYLFKGQEEA